MKKYFLFLTVIMIPILLIGDSTHFRKVNWKMTQKMVVSIENKNHFFGYGGLNYTVKIFDKDIQLSYFFKKDRLFKAVYDSSLLCDGDLNDKINNLILDKYNPLSIPENELRIYLNGIYEFEINIEMAKYFTYLQNDFSIVIIEGQGTPLGKYIFMDKNYLLNFVQREILKKKQDKNKDKSDFKNEKDKF